MPEEFGEFISFGEAVSSLEAQIDRNLNALGNHVDQLKRVDPVIHPAFKQEFDEMVSWYDTVLTNCRTTGESGTDEEKAENLDNLRLILNYTQEAIQGIGEALPQHDDPEISTGEEPGTAMVTSTTDQGDDVIEMQQVGAFQAFWAGLSPGTKGLLKIAGIGLAIYGAKKGLEYAGAQWKGRKKKRKEPEPEIEEEEEE